MRAPERLGLAAALLLSVGCGARAPANDRQVVPVNGSNRESEWRDAQRDIAALYPPAEGDPFDVSPREFVIQKEREPFYCGETGIHAVLLVYGCFRAEPQEKSLGVIRYVPGREALRHEARHAILFALGDDRWADVGH